MRKGIRNLHNRLEDAYHKTVAELEADGLVFTDYHHFNFSSYVDETSGMCITPYKERNTDFSAYDDEFEAYGYKFSLRFYELFDFWGPGECKVDFSSIECWDFQKFADELNDLLESEGVIMQTWKYKASALLPAPVCVWDGYGFGGFNYYGRVYKLPKINYKKLEKVAAKIKELALSHLVWDEVDDEQEAI